MDAFLQLPDGRAVPVRDALVIGRVAGCDVQIDDTKASRRHARLRVEGSVVEIEDLGSSNGTLLNGKPVQRRMLHDGDQLQIGGTVLVFHEQAASAPSATSAPSPSAPSAPSPPPAGPSAPADEFELEAIDLFGDDPDEDYAAEAPPVAAPPPPAVKQPRPAAAASPGVVEFADEVVEVRAQKPRPGAAAPPPPSGVEIQQQRVLQFSKHASKNVGKNGPGRGVLGDDLGQMSAGTRMLVYALVLAGAAGLAWLVITLLR